MVRPSSPRALDEVHCLWPHCSHSCCWQAEQRLLDGKPRLVKAQTTLRAAPATHCAEERFPVFTVVNVSLWPFMSFPLDSQEEAFLNDTPIHRPERQENVQMPHSRSATPSRLESSRENKTVKIRKVTLSPLTSATTVLQSSKPKVVPVRSSGSGPPCSARSPRLAVKELVFPPTSEVDTSLEDKKQVREEKVRQRALTLKAKSNQEVRGPLKPKADTDRSDPGLSWPGSQQLCAPAAEAKDEPGSEHHGRPPVKKPVSERRQRRLAPDQYRTSKCKLNFKGAQSGVDRIDWTDLRRQTHLWKWNARPVSSGRAEDKADPVKSSLNPFPEPLGPARRSSTTGRVNCKKVEFINGLRMIFYQFLASTSKDGPRRRHHCRFCFSTGFLKSGTIPTPDSQQSSRASSVVKLTRYI